jgi:hypothetical protein
MLFVIILDQEKYSYNRSPSKIPIQLLDQAKMA